MELLDDPKIPVITAARMTEYPTVMIGLIRLVKGYFAFQLSNRLTTKKRVTIAKRYG